MLLGKLTSLPNLLAVLLAVFSLLLVTPSVVSAQSPKPSSQSDTPNAGINLTLSPTFLNLTANPKERIDSQFRIRNNSNFTENLRIRLAKFETIDGGKPVLSDVTSSDTFVSWVDMPEEEFSVSPNETKSVKFSITPPEEASLGYYYAFVVERQRERGSEGQTAIVAGSPALLTLLEVRSPNAKRELQLVDFKTSKLWYEYLPTEFVVRVKNSGNVHIVPTGNIFIDQGNNKDIAILSANESRGNILPQTEREYTSSWTDGFAVRVPKEEKLPDGTQVVKNSNGETEYHVQYDFQKADKFRIGKYTANLLLVYDNGERDVPLEATISFWVIPWKIIGIGIIVFLFVFLGIRSTLLSAFRRFKK